jgi:ribosomal silencing factor RsfS
MPKNRCFSSKRPDDNDKEEDELAQWIPPDRPLVGDKGSSHLYERRGDAEGHAEEATFPELDQEEELRQLELELQRQEEHEKQKSKVSNVQEPVDWLQTRRSKQWDGVDMMTPDLGTTKKFQASDVAVIPHTLLTKDEITSCLTAMGGKNITLLPNTPERRMGAASGMILTTGSTPTQIFLMADTLVRQLKRRDLAEVGVVGAQFGAEGSADKTDTWRVVDCFNYIVHILDANTRRHLNLEALWSGKDASLRVRFDDDDAMDDYVAANPVPEGYSPNAQDWSSSISQMERNRWIVPHRPVVPRPKGRKRRRGRR